MLAELVKKYGYGDRPVSKRALGITYEEAKQEKIFNETVVCQLKSVVEEDRGHTVMMGSTTMALAARGVALFFPGMIALRVMVILWKDGLIA